MGAVTGWQTTGARLAAAIDWALVWHARASMNSKKICTRYNVFGFLSVQHFTDHRNLGSCLQLPETETARPRRKGAGRWHLLEFRHQELSAAAHQQSL